MAQPTRVQSAKAPPKTHENPDRTTEWNVGLLSLAAALTGIVIVVVSVAAGRAEVAIIGLPIVLSWVWGWFNRPRGGVEVTTRSGLPDQELGDVGGLQGTITLQAPAEVTAMQMRVATPGYRVSQAVIATRPGREIAVTMDSARTGILECFRVDHIAVGVEDVLAARTKYTPALRMMVRPTERPMRSVPLPFRLQGLVGQHTSRRVGEGMELHDIHEFTPGDRLRRIDWRTTVRRSMDPRTGRLGQLYVRRTLSSAEATVMLVVDSRDDVGPEVDTWAGGGHTRMTQSTSVDIARQAAATIARVYLNQGDRVGLDDLGRRSRPVAPAAGRKHLERIMQRLVRIAPEGSPSPRMRSPQVPSGALVVMFSTFLDDEPGKIAARWRSQGHRVVVVDVLPQVNTTGLDYFDAAAYRLVRLERGLRLAALRKQGIDVVHWVPDPDGHGGPMGPEQSLMLAATARGGRR